MKQLLPTLITFFLLAACDTSTPESSTLESSTGKDSAAPNQRVSNKSAVELSSYVNHYLKQARSQCASALIDARKLDTTIEQLLKQTDPNHLTNAQQMWLSAQNSWLSCSLYRPNGGPLDQPLNTDPFPLYERIGSWPVSAGFVDSLPDYPYSGIINSPAPEITRQELLDQHQLTAPNEASVGLYVIEVLLFGSHGERSAEDFTPDSAEETTPEEEQVNAKLRRRAYLQVSSSIYLNDLKSLMGQLDPQLAVYPQSLAKLTLKQQHKLLLGGLHKRIEDIRTEFNDIREQYQDYPLSQSWHQRAVQPLKATALLFKNKVFKKGALADKVPINEVLTDKAQHQEGDLKKQRDEQPGELLISAINSAEQLKPADTENVISDSAFEKLNLELQALNTALAKKLLNYSANTITAPAEQLHSQ